MQAEMADIKFPPLKIYLLIPIYLRCVDSAGACQILSGWVDYLIIISYEVIMSTDLTNWVVLKWSLLFIYEIYLSEVIIYKIIVFHLSKG